MNYTFIIILANLFSFVGSTPQSSTNAGKDFEYYLNLNNKETRLIEFKDDEQSLKLKFAQLEVINESRRKNNASPVHLDILASRVANKMSAEAAINDYTSHWNLNGEKPYHRYAIAGGYDHITENAFGEWRSDNYDTSDSQILALMNTAHSTFMAEKAPANGHKLNIIEKVHNFVGIGYFMQGNQFRYYEEFIDRYYTFENIPKLLKPGEAGSITITTDGQNYLNYLIIYRENAPSPLKISQLKKTGGYDDFTNEQYKAIYAWELAKFRKGNTYNIPLSFTKEGWYYIQIFQDKEEITKPESISTKGKVQASGIVIKVAK